MIDTTELIPAATLLTYRQAAELSGYSVDTIKLDRKNGLYPNALQDDSRRKVWLIPVEDLVSAGRIDASCIAQVESALAYLTEAKEIRELREENIRLKEQLAAALARAEELATDKVMNAELIAMLVKKAA